MKLVCERTINVAEMQAVIRHWQSRKWHTVTWWLTQYIDPQRHYVDEKIGLGLGTVIFHAACALGPVSRNASCHHGGSTGTLDGISEEAAILFSGAIAKTLEEAMTHVARLRVLDESQGHPPGGQFQEQHNSKKVSGRGPRNCAQLTKGGILSGRIGKNSEWANW